MKNLYKLLALTVGVLSLSACEADRDSNPTLNEPDTFVLNVPPFAANNVYDLKNSQSIALTCSQPDYGVPMATTYSVQVSLQDQFVDADEAAGTVANYVTLGTTHTTAKMDVDALEFALAVGELWTASSEEDIPTTPIPVYVRLKAELTNSGRGITYSNVVELPNVLAYEATPPLTLPENLFVCGAISGKNWDVWMPLAPANGMSQYFGLFYFKGDGTDEFKFGTKANEWLGADTEGVTLSDKFTGLDGGNIRANVDAPGWYVIVVTAGIKGSAYTFAFDLIPGEVHLIGTVIGQSSWGFDDAGLFTAPAQADADFVSPAIVAGGEVRMSVKVLALDWWRTEFTLKGGAITFRGNMNIVNNWATDGGADYSVAVTPGQTIHLNFAQGTGSVQ